MGNVRLIANDKMLNYKPSELELYLTGQTRYRLGRRLTRKQMYVSLQDDGTIAFSGISSYVNSRRLNIIYTRELKQNETVLDFFKQTKMSAHTLGELYMNSKTSFDNIYFLYPQSGFKFSLFFEDNRDFDFNIDAVNTSNNFPNLLKLLTQLGGNSDGLKRPAQGLFPESIDYPRYYDRIKAAVKEKEMSNTALLNFLIRQNFGKNKKLK